MSSRYYLGESFLMRLRVCIRGRDPPYVRLSQVIIVQRSLKSSDDMTNDDAMSDDEEVASDAE